MRLALASLSAVCLLCLTVGLGIQAAPQATGAAPTTLRVTVVDTDGDGIPDDVDNDDDNDGVPDVSDSYPTNPSVCQDADSDGCDDCSVGTDGFGPLPDVDPNNDGPDFDGDGLCDSGDPDDDDDGVPDNSDTCHFTPNADDPDSDNDGFGDVCDCVWDDGNIPTADADGDGYGVECDCNDTDASVFPGHGCETVPVEKAPWSHFKQIYR